MLRIYNTLSRQKEEIRRLRERLDRLERRAAGAAKENADKAEEE